MLTDNDRKYLQEVVGKKGATMQMTMFCMIPLLILVGFLKFYAASIWLQLTNYSIHGFLVRWVAGTSADKYYSGYFIKAADDVTLGLVYLGLAVLNALGWWKGRLNRERTQRIVNALKASDNLL